MFHDIYIKAVIKFFIVLQVVIGCECKIILQY